MLKILCLAALLPFGASAALADPAAKQVPVHYDDLNLHSAAGVQVLVNRIQAASRTACGTQGYVTDLAMRQLLLSCQRTAVRDALAHLNLPMVTAANKSDAPGN